MQKCTQEINHHASMESKPKRWMIQPLSQRLEPTDACPMRSCTANDLLRRDQSCSYSESSNSTTLSHDILSFTCTQSLDIVSSQRKEVPHDAMVQAKQEAVLDEVDNANNDWHPSSPSSHRSLTSNKGSHCGFYSFVEDPSSPEAELNKNWMVSQERKTKLVTLKNKDSFKLQTYSSGRKPQSLFDENNGDSRYQVNDNGVQNVNKHDEKQLRQQIIYTQAPKQTLTQAQHFDTAEEKNLSIYHTTKERFGVKVRQRSNSSDTKNVLNPKETEFYTHKSSTPDKQEEPIHHESPSFLVKQTNKMTVSKYYSPTTLVSIFDKTKSFYPCDHPTARPSCFCIVTAQPWSSQHPTLPVVSRVLPLMSTSAGVKMGDAPAQKSMANTLTAPWPGLVCSLGQLGDAPPKGERDGIFP